MVEEREQEDVLRHKDHVTKSSRGLQQWSDEGEAPEGTGAGGSGTAERAARITRGQKQTRDDG